MTVKQDFTIGTLHLKKTTK